jgi:hypothetical protein
MHFLKLLEPLLDAHDRKVAVQPLPEITMAALQIATIRDLKLKVAERRNRRGFEKHLFGCGSVRKSNQPFIETKLYEFFVLLWDRGIFPSTKSKKELIGVQIKLIKLIRVYIEKIRFLKVLEKAGRGQNETSILGRHLGFPRGRWLLFFNRALWILKAPHSRSLSDS